MNKMITMTIMISLLVVLSGCGSSEVEQTPTPTPTPTPVETPTPTPEPEIELEYTDEGIIKPNIAKQIIEEISDQVMLALKEKDIEELASFIHPEKGLRFTPYTYVSVENDLVFTKQEMETFFEDEQKYIWGQYDGKGHDIDLTPTEYYEEFVYTHDFLNADEIGYNEVLTSGNMFENQFDVYDEPIIVEYHFPNFDPDFMGMDWRSLRLVFEEHQGEWLLVGIIHNQWTI